MNFLVKQMGDLKNYQLIRIQVLKDRCKSKNISFEHLILKMTE